MVLPFSKIGSIKGEVDLAQDENRILFWTWSVWDACYHPGEDAKSASD